MSDFSLFSLFTAGLALFAPLATAYTKPVGDSPKGNPISQPGFMSVVPAGKPFTVTWEPTTPGTVTLVLLKGPAENAQPQYAIVENIPNDGVYAWTPSKHLEPTDGAEGYGIQLICDKDGQYQYTTQFGISNPDYSAADTSSSAAPASTSSSAAAGGWGAHGHSGWGHGGHNVHGGYTHPAASGTASAAPSSMTSAYTPHGNGTTTTAGAGGAAHSSGWVKHNITMATPTGGHTTKTNGVAGPTGYGGSGASASGSTPAGPQATDNGAAAMVSSLGGLVLAAGAAMLAL